MKYCFVFVCQLGELEIKSMLLATSLKQYLSCEYELVVAIPEPSSRWGQISKKTYELIKFLDIRIEKITNRIDDNYPIGNKISCLSIDTPAAIIIFLDSDILCLRSFSPKFKFSVYAKPADLNTFSKDSNQWQTIYNLFQLPLPKAHVLSSTSGELMLPYFNAGVIAVPNGLNFGKIWEETCQKIDATESIKNKRPWLDQIALPVTLKRLNLDYQCLDERFNYPAHIKPLPTKSENLPFLCHYHWANVIRREPILNKLVIKLTKKYPQLVELINSSDKWATLLKPYKFKQKSSIFNRFSILKHPKNLPNQSANIIITGLPRSGTSYLCRLLHSIPNYVIINEPSAIFESLANELMPWQIAIFYQNLRKDILDGIAVENKIHQGQIIEDTAVVDTRTNYYPTISRPDFLLGTKNTLTYLSRLSQLGQVLPDAKIIACIRHPFDTIASWKTSFPHLNQAKVLEFPIGHPHDSLLASWQRQRLQEIATTTNEALKRALLWRYLAEIILNYKKQLILIHYENLVTQPVKVLKSIIKQIPHAPHLANFNKIKVSNIRQKREVLTKEDLQAIKNICSEYAIKLSYNLVDEK
ncbi:MAG: sulfotransferase [Thiomargarita sp.]|nr:sulfotransferase [Thiomargarita sp.]